MTLKIRELYDQSMGIYGNPRIFCDLREAGLVCGENRVARSMSAAQSPARARLQARPRYKVGKPALVAPISRLSICWDNGVVESLFINLMSERIKKRIYSTRGEAKSEVFDYIEGLYNRARRHKHLNQLSPLEFERRQTTL